MSFEWVKPADGLGHVAILAALDVECASLRRPARSAAWAVTQCGPGAARAATAAQAALAAGATGLVSWGLAGGLQPWLAPGAVVAPRRVLAQGAPARPVDARWHARLAALGDEFTLHDGDLLTVPRALETPEEKRRAATASGAIAVDMESAALATVAAQAQVPFAVVRVIVDGVADALPRGAEEWIDEQGNRRLVPALRLAVHPGEWWALVTLTRRFAVARRVLERLAGTLAERNVFADSNASRPAER